ncbi:MAG TPA: YmaF family protein [Spirochaetia bacterium]|nr:YmaF family protein [Spirochaetia bacterium]
MSERHHVHIFSAKTPPDPGHIHFYAGISGPAVGEELAHAHLIRATTTVYNDHDHLIDLATGPGIPTGAGHVHLITGATSENGAPPHQNHLNSLTGPSLPVR